MGSGIKPPQASALGSLFLARALASLVPCWSIPVPNPPPSTREDHFQALSLLEPFQHTPSSMCVSGPPTPGLQLGSHDKVCFWVCHCGLREGSHQV